MKGKLRSGLLILATISLLTSLTSCKKSVFDRDTPDYEIRDKMAGKALGDWAAVKYVGIDYPQGLTDKDELFADDRIYFKEGPRWKDDPTGSGLIPAGTGYITQGDKLQWPYKDKVINFEWHGLPERVNTFVMTVYDSNHKEIGGNEFHIDEANWHLVISSIYRYRWINGVYIKEPYTSLYEYNALPKTD